MAGDESIAEGVAASEVSEDEAASGSTNQSSSGSNDQTGSGEDLSINDVATEDGSTGDVDNEDDGQPWWQAQGGTENT